MKQYCIFFVVSISGFQALAQPGLQNKLQDIADSIEHYRAKKIAEISSDSANERYFSKGGYDRFFDKYFTRIKYERETILSFL